MSKKLKFYGGLIILLFIMMPIAIISICSPEKEGIKERGSMFPFSQDEYGNLIYLSTLN